MRRGACRGLTFVGLAAIFWGCSVEDGTETEELSPERRQQPLLVESNAEGAEVFDDGTGTRSSVPSKRLATSDQRRRA